MRTINKENISRCCLTWPNANRTTPLPTTLSSCLLKSQQPISLPPSSFYQHNLHFIHLSYSSTFLLLDILTTSWNCWNFKPFDCHPTSFTNLKYQVFWCQYLPLCLLHISSYQKTQHSTYYWHTYYPKACYPALQQHGVHDRRRVKWQINLIVCCIEGLS